MLGLKMVLFAGFLLICGGPVLRGEDISQVKHGIVCLTFDDGRYPGWLAQVELFRKYRARATFFYSGEITPDAAESMNVLRRNGHSVGLHALHHRDCPADGDFQQYFDTEIKPQLDAAAKYGVTDIRYFAYPNNRHTQKSDAFLGKYFTRFRAGLGIGKHKGFRIADEDAAFLPLAGLPSRKVLGGCGIGPYYGSSEENLDGALERAARENRLIVFFSHGIVPGARRVDMSPELLEHLLKKASGLRMQILGFDELPCLPEK